MGKLEKLIEKIMKLDKNLRFVEIAKVYVEMVRDMLMEEDF